MTWAEILGYILAALAGAGGAAVLLFLAPVGWVGRIIAEQVSIRTTAAQNRQLEELKNRYAGELEELRASFAVGLESVRIEAAERRELVSTMRAALSSGFSSSHGEVLASVKALWTAVLGLRSLSERRLLVYTLFSPEQRRTLPRAEMESFMKPLMSDPEFADIPKTFQRDVEKVRPFVGEEIWTVYMVYYTFVISIVWKINHALKRKVTIPEWNKNMFGKEEGLEELLEIVFSKDYINGIVNNPSPEHHVPQRIMDALEIKMLGTIGEVLFGRKLIDANLAVQNWYTQHPRDVAQAQPQTTDVT